MIGGPCYHIFIPAGLDLSFDCFKHQLKHVYFVDTDTSTTVAHYRYYALYKCILKKNWISSIVSFSVLIHTWLNSKQSPRNAHSANRRRSCQTDQPLR